MKYWIWLSRIELLDNKTKKKLLEIYSSPKRIYELSKKELRKQNISEEMINDILNPKYKQNLEQYINYMKKNKIEMITLYNDKSYPNKLKFIYDSPIILYIQGNKELLYTLSIGLVGCRNCSTYGMKVAKNIAYQLAKKGITIVSGLARGIDTYSHIGTINAKGNTIAVLGCGLDVIYPPENRELKNKIVTQNGLIVSEYIIGTKPLAKHFPARNRIISALVENLIVVEARKKSGVFITVDFALEQGKDVYAVPGNIDNPTAQGTNMLIQQGAIPLTCIEDILNLT